MSALESMNLSPSLVARNFEWDSMLNYIFSFLNREGFFINFANEKNLLYFLFQINVSKFIKFLKHKSMLIIFTLIRNYECKIRNINSSDSASTFTFILQMLKHTFWRKHEFHFYPIKVFLFILVGLFEFLSP